MEMPLVVCTPSFLHGSHLIISYFLSFHQMTPLHLAAESDHIKVVKYLFEQGADINIQDDNGVSICDCTYQCC